MYYCPLCLQPLSASQDRLMRYCPSHNKLSGEFDYSDDDQAFLFCSECASADSLEIKDQPYFLHVGCRSKNPFWNEDEQKVRVDSSAPFGIKPDQGWDWNRVEQFGVLKAAAEKASARA